MPVCVCVCVCVCVREGASERARERERELHYMRTQHKVYVSKVSYIHTKSTLGRRHGRTWERG